VSESAPPEAADTPDFSRYITGSTNRDYVDSVLEAARDGDPAAISRVKNDSGDLIDHHGISEDEINDILG
jgi:hypothetical protein